MDEMLYKPERWLVLQGIDCKDRLAENLPIDSFFTGFRHTLKLSQGLHT